MAFARAFSRSAPMTDGGARHLNDDLVQGHFIVECLRGSEHTIAAHHTCFNGFTIK